MLLIAEYCTTDVTPQIYENFRVTHRIKGYNIYTSQGQYGIFLAISFECQCERYSLSNFLMSFYNIIITIVERGNVKTDLRRHVWGLQAKFMHDPTCFDPIGSSVPVKHKRLPHPYELSGHRINHRSIFPRCLPVSRCCCPIRPKPRRILSVTEAEEVPLACIELCHLCDVVNNDNNNNNNISKVNYINQ